MCQGEVRGGSKLFVGEKGEPVQLVLLFLLPFNTPETPLLFRGVCEEDTLVFSQKGENALRVCCLAGFCLLVFLKRLERWD